MSDAPDPARDPVGALEARLGVTFRDRARALAALTHKSYVNEHRDEPGLADNERLEFLGDAVIDLAVSHRLMERFPGAKEGELSKMRAAVVDEAGLAGLARGLDLGPILRLGRGEELTGGRAKASLLADAMEAVIAAVFLGEGLPPVLGIVDRFLGEAFARAAAGTLDRDYKTQLQELSQSRLRATPRYRVVAERGPDHSKVFEVETDLRGEVLGRGEGRSKKDAEQAAARLALEALARRFGEGEAAAPEVAAATATAPAEAPADAPSVPPEASPEVEAVLSPHARPEATPGPEPVAAPGPSPEEPTPAKPGRRRKAAEPRKPVARASAAKGGDAPPKRKPARARAGKR